MHQILEQIEADAHSRPSPIEFEMAYQARVAIDRIKFAIKHTELFAPRTDTIREAGLQLLDALERLESVERRFQQRSRSGRSLSPSEGTTNGNQMERGAFVTPRAGAAHSGGSWRTGETPPAAPVTTPPNCKDDHMLPLMEKILDAR